MAQYTPTGWDDTDGTVRYDSPELGWIEVTRAVLVDPCNTVLADVPAREWRRVVRRHSRLLRTGRAYLIGLARGEVES